MKDINIYSAESVKEISDFLKENKEKSRVMAGGTDLLGTLKEKILPVEIDQVVSMKGMDELKGIDEKTDCIEIGAMTTLDEIENSQMLKEHVPLLTQAAHVVASPQIRHMATIGGNICQEPRCWYYRYQGDKFNCMRKGGERCNAVVGNNIYHSIYGAAKVKETPCTSNCPNETDISGYMECIRQGNIRKAAQILFSVNPIAAVTGRICPHTCQQHCNRKKYDESVSIRAVERYLGDYILDNAGEFYKAPEITNGKMVYIVGAGPSGLTAAYYLRKNGFNVTVFDQNEKIGGMLYYGIPEYRLPKAILDRIKEVLENMGIVFMMETKIGKDFTAKKLYKDSDVLFIGIGAWTSTNMEFEGRDADGIMSAMEFLHGVSEKKDQKIGKKVVVIGGGNTSFDVCRSAVKMGAEEVILLARRPIDKIAADKDEVDAALKEGVKVLDLTTLKKVIKNDDNTIASLELQKTKVEEIGEEGEYRIIPDEGNTEVIDADNLILALGQGIDTRGFEKISSKKGIYLQDEDTGQTAEENVYAAGDAAYGPATVIKAIYRSRKAAESISADYLEELGGISDEAKAKLFSENALDKTESIKEKEMDVAERTLYEEISETVDLDDVCREADRCLNCGCVAVSPSDTGAALAALDAVIVTNEREIPVSEFFATPIMGSTCLGCGEVVTAIRVPKNAGKCQMYIKHRTRKSIDFPIADIAINGDVEDNVVKKISIVFGAVAPTPIRLTEAEEYLTGRELSEPVVEHAAELAVRDCLPLKENEYKIKTVKVLLRRNLAKLMK